MTIQLVDAGTGVGHFKGGLYGNAGSGKSWTATLLALGIKKHLGLKGRIFFFDTETGVEYVNHLVVKATGEAIRSIKSRTLADAIEFLHAAEEQGASVAIVDSVTHIWEEVQKSYLAQMNKRLEAQKKPLRTKIEWQDRGLLNDIWEKFTNAYLNTKTHTIICGRAANIWEMSVNEETGKKELNKVGTKMKTQSELAYEPSFLAEMEREQVYEDGTQKIVRTMTVLKERFGVLDGKQFQNPTFEAILPHVAMLTPGASNTIDTERQTDLGVNDDGDTAWKQESLARQIACEKIEAMLDKAFTGQSADMKLARKSTAEIVFGTLSWTEIERLPSHKLNDGIAILHHAIETVREKIEADRVEAEKVAHERKQTKGAAK